MNDDLISRQRLLKELKHHKELFCRNRIEFLGLSKNDKARADEIDNCIATVINMQSAQPEEAIPVAWLEEQAKWFESMDNAFAKIEASNIRVMIKKWRMKKDEGSD